MGEPWEFDDEGDAPLVPERRATFAWLHELSPDAQRGMFVIAFILTCVVLLLVFVVADAVGWKAWVFEKLQPLQVWGSVALVLLVVAVPVVCVVAFVRGLLRGDLNEAWWTWGRWFGVVVGNLTFVGSWLSATKSWGWLLGIAFGWIPAAIVAAMAGLLAWALAPIAALILIGLGLWALAWWRSTNP